MRYEGWWYGGKSCWLNNFELRFNSYDGAIYPFVWFTYMSVKSTDQEWRAFFLRTLGMPRGVFKRRCQKIELRKGWDEMKASVMLELLEQKFARWK